MATALTEAPLVERHGRHVALGSEPTALLWLGLTAAATLGEGSVRWLGDDGAVATVPVHAGAILAACRHPDGDSIITGGDDGRVCRVTPAGEMAELGRFPRKWVEHLVTDAGSGLIVAGVGREAIVWARGSSAPSHRFEVASTIGGLALDGKGKRLSIAHYGGASLVFAANPASSPVALPCAGSHLACTMSADGRYLITALQEAGLHGWRLPERRDMRMSGYAAKTRSFSWDRRGKWLATSGDARAILWPFEGKTGPMGKAPLLRGESEGTIVSCVAFHPCDEVLALGYSDGAVALARLADERVLAIAASGGGGYVTALAWNDAGTRLGWGGEDGRVGILDMGSRG